MNTSINRRVWFQRFLSLVLGIALTAPMLASGRIARAEVNGTTYTSPQFGFTVTWPDTWFVVEEDSQDYDFLGLTDGLAFVGVVGANESAGNPTIEVAKAVVALKLNSKISNVKPNVTLDPPIQQPDTGNWVSMAASYTYTRDDGSTADFIDFDAARTLTAGQSVIFFMATVPAELMAAEAASIQAVLAGVAVPAEGGAGAATADQAPLAGEPGPVFVSGQWRVAVASAAVNDAFGNLKLKSKSGKEWVVVIADVTNWSEHDGAFAARDFRVRAGDDGKLAKLAPSSTVAVAKTLGTAELTDEATIAIPAGKTQRIALIFAIPAGGRDLALVRSGDALPLDDVLAAEIDSSALPRTAVPPDVTKAAIVSASDGRTLRVQADGKSSSQRIRLLGVQPPADGACDQNEAEKLLDGLAGRDVLIEEDAAVAGGSTPNRYLWLVNDDGTRTLINADLISRGFASAANLPSDARFGGWLQEAERAAKAAPAGQWADCATDTKTSATPVSTASPTAKPASAGSTPATTFDLELRDISFSQTNLTVPAGKPVTFHLTNTGVATHTFTLDLDSFTMDGPELPSGQSATMFVTFEHPGTYTFYCRIPGHREAGMVGTITVVADTNS